MFEYNHVILNIIQILAALLIFVLGLGILVIIGMYIADISQTTHAIRKNYPVVGRFRYLFEHMGEFLRQYFFAQDREEMPFNRAQRSWVYRSAKDIDTTVAFGSTRSLKGSGTIMFANCPFPTLGKDAVKPQLLTIGENCKKPYTTASLFNISGMSFGAISRPAVLSNGARMSGAWMNTGEGGLSPYHLEGGADLIFQIGTAKYGVRDKEGKLSDEKLMEAAAHEQVKMFEIKLSQGAKPGKGGILPGAKVTEQIAKIRGIEVGQDSISPNRHTDINNIDELLKMIMRVRKVTGKPVGFKTVIGAYGWIENLFEEINKRGSDFAPDFITIDSADGGTGAAPMSLMDYMGMPLSESLPLVVDMLDKYQLRDRVKVICSGKLVNPAEAAWALCMGADFIVSARGPMFALGCIQALQCNKNTCPTGITTHHKKLQRGLNPKHKAQRVKNYINHMVYEIGVISHSCGVREPRELKRFHCRAVIENGKSKSMQEIYPDYSNEV